MARYCSWAATVLCTVMLMQTAAALQHKVGGNRGWAPPSGSEKETYNQWAERTRFLINDSLVFTYNPSVDSVLEVSKQDYETCTTTNPINSFKDGNTVFVFPRHSAFYFISGNATNCQKGEKLHIVVLAPRNPRKSTVSPAPAPTVASPPSPGAAPASPPSPAVSPSVVPVASPTVAPVVSPTVASAPSTGAGPAMTPTISAPTVFSPAPTPTVSEGGVVPSGSAGNLIRPCFASAAFALFALAISSAI